MSIMTSPALRYPKSLWSYNPSPTGCALYLPFWHPSLSGPVFKDIGPSGGTCTVATATWTTLGYDFDGVSGLLTVPDTIAIQNIFDNGGTIECWIDADSDGEGDEGNIADKTRWSFYLANEAIGKVKVVLWCNFDGATNGTWITTSTEVDINTWTHIVVTYNSSATANDAIIYINGTAVALTESATPDGTRVTDVGSGLTIGNFSTDAFTFDGTIGEVRLYNRILSATEIVDDYNITKFRYV
ncbi:hypothetical protein LCGC14_0931160 [marine sediment metagenome]|uniref:LamG-like jellyroll fold domain-containing protein n=1 Tax=marine sediment metagenome TaxID=412755 RepID=A0A0F9NSH8_9ZZZZ